MHTRIARGIIYRAFEAQEEHGMTPQEVLEEIEYLLDPNDDDAWSLLHTMRQAKAEGTDPGRLLDAVLRTLGKVARVREWLGISA